MDSHARKKLAAVEVVLRKGREPHSRRYRVALLHEVASLIDLGQESADGDVVGGYAVHPCQFSFGFINPEVAAHLRQDGRRPRSRSVTGIRLHPELGEKAVPAWFVRHPRIDKC